MALIEAYVPGSSGSGFYPQGTREQARQQPSTLPSTQLSESDPRVTPLRVAHSRCQLSRRCMVVTLEVWVGITFVRAIPVTGLQDSDVPS